MSEKTFQYMVTSSVIFVAVCLFGMFVWPTLYRYDYPISGIIVAVVKINRMTGNATIVKAEAVVHRERGIEEPVFPLPADQLAEIKIDDASVGGSELYLKVYNNSIWNVRKLEVETDVGVSGTRLYQMTNNYDMKPHTAGFFTIFVTSGGSQKGIRCRLVSAAGLKSLQ